MEEGSIIAVEGRLVGGQAERLAHVALRLDVLPLVLQDKGQAVERVDVAWVMIERHFEHGLPDFAACQNKELKMPG
jgi:hypothetical protein